MTTEASALILSALEEVEPLMERAFKEVGGSPEPGSALDQVFLRDGRIVITDYLKHGEAGLALEHLIYMIREPDLAISPDTHRRLLDAGEQLGYPSATFDDITVR